MRAVAGSLCWLWLTACAAERAVTSIDVELSLAERALREGRIEVASERIAEARRRAPRHVEAAQWAAVLAEITWRDEDAVRSHQVAIRNARSLRYGEERVAVLEGRLGDLLFASGRWGESVAPLLAGAAVEDGDRRRAFSACALVLPFARKPGGPLLSEQRLLPGDMPEFLCGAGERLLPFAIDTGTSMTTLARSLADELAVRERRPAGEALDGAGRALPIDIAVVEQFAVGDIDIGAVPVAIVDDAAMQMRDLFGGPERVSRGVLGLDLLGACRLTLDPERSSVVIELPRGLPEEQSVQCVRVQGRCLVPVLIEDVRMWFVLDTGASHSSLSVAGLDRLPGGAGRAVPSFRRVRTVGGSLVSVREVRELVVSCSEARFRGVTLPVVARGGDTLFPVHGVLGVDILSRCRVILDRGRARLVALPQSR